MSEPESDILSSGVPNDVTSVLLRARSLAALGDDEAAKQTYLEVLRLDPGHVGALIELGALAEASGHRSAALSAYREAVRLDPGNTVARTGLANLLRETGDLLSAQEHYQAALAAEPMFAAAHQGLAQVLTALGDPAADYHLRVGFAGRSVIRQRYRGQGTGIPILLLVAGCGGNVPTSTWIDNRHFAVTAVCADFYDPTEPLPPHSLIFNAIGDADLCGPALSNAEKIATAATAPVLNHPSRVRETTRQNNARRLANVGGVLAPVTTTLDRSGLADAARTLRYPLLLRSPGYHTGQNFVRVETADRFDECAASLPGTKLLAIQYLDGRGADGMSRKYRVMFIDGVIYPLHLAISTDWKVHYFTAAMTDHPDHRKEERRFLEDFPSALGARATAALSGIQDVLGLDYGGVDFAVASDGSLLLFEANATMVINPAGRETMWDYRRPSINAAIEAAGRMVSRVARAAETS